MIAVTGWAFGEESLQPLSAALAPVQPVEIFTPAALLGAGGVAGRSGGDQGCAAGPTSAAADVHQGLPASRLEIVNGAGHALPLRHAGEIAGRMLAFLRGLPQR